MGALTALNAYGPGRMFVVGTLGCSQGNKEDKNLSEALLRYKLILTCPNRLLVYGPLAKRYKSVLDEFGVTSIVFPEFRRRSFDAALLRKGA